MPTYLPYKITKDEGAYIYAESGQFLATGSTGAGGYLNTQANASGWNNVRFINVVGTGITLPLDNPSGTLPTTAFMSTGTVLGGATPNGDIRGEGTGFVDITGGGNSYSFLKGTNYSGAIYGIYEKTGDPTKERVVKIGVGTTTSEISTSGYYEGNFTTNEFYEFTNSFTPNTGNFDAITTGSGIFVNGRDITIQTELQNTAGQILNTAPALAADPIISGQRISILDIDGNMVFRNFRNYGNTNFTFTARQNEDVFGEYRDKLGFQIDVVNQDATVQTNVVNVYGGGPPHITTVDVRASGGIFRNESPDNISAPDTAGMSTADATETKKFFSNNLINTTGISGAFDFRIAVDNNLSKCLLNEVAFFASNSGNFLTNRGTFLGSYALRQLPSQHIRVANNTDTRDGVDFTQDTYFKIVASSRVGKSTEIWDVGPNRAETIRADGPNPVWDGGSNTIRGDGANLKVTNTGGSGYLEADYFAGSGVSGRITDPYGNLYLISGEGGGGGVCCTLQDTVDVGNTSTTDIYMNGSSLFYINSYIRHVGDANTYFGFPDNDEFRLVTNGQARLDFTSDGATMYDPLGKASVEIGKDGYSIQSEDSSIIAAFNSVINSTGCLIGGGSGHQISGNYDVIAGGVTNNISGGDFNFIGGGSQIDLTGSDYSSSIGGKNNDIFNSDYSIVGGGQNNKIESATISFIGGGESNEIYNDASAIGGGVANLISGGNGYAFIGGGEENEVHGQFSSVLGGEGNKVYGTDAVTLGGWFTESSGQFSLVGPGRASKVSGDHAFALGNKAEIPTAHSGAAVLADGQDRVHASSGAHTAVLDFASGVFVPSTGFFNGLHVSGVPVSTGAAAASSDTLQDVTTRGNTTTTSMAVQGQYLSGVSGVFDTVDITGTDTLTVTGNVGIGTTPAYKLHVNSSTTDEVARFGSSDNVAYITITDSAETGVTGFIGVDNVGGPKRPNMSIGLNSSMTSSSNLYITTGGRLGVGHNDPNHQLTVGGSIRATDDIELGPNSEIDWHNGNSKIVGGLDGTYSLSLQTHDGDSLATKMVITSGGYIGIGTTAPLAMLDVRGDISGSGNFLGTGVGQRITAADGKPYLVSGDSPADSNSFVTGATFGTSDGVLTLKRNDSLADVTVDLDGRFTDNAFADAMNQGVASGDSPTFNSVDITGTSTLTVTGSVQGTGVGNRITNNHIPYLLSGDVTTSELGLGTAATKDVGISNNNVIQANNTLVDNDFLRVDGTQVEGRSASEVLSDIGGQASLTFGISNTNAVKIDSASVADDEYAKFTSAGLESRSTSEVLSDIGGVADGGSPTFDSIYLQNTIYHDGDTDTRIDVSADTIQLATAGTTALTIASNSHVGIGTDSPNAAYKLHTQGLNYATGAVIGGSYAGQSPPENGLAIEGKTAIGYYTTSNNLGIYGNASVGTSYITSSAPSNGIIVQGNVGIGNNDPQTELDVSGAIKGGFNLSAKSADFTLDASHNGTFFNGTSTSFDQISISSDLGASFNCSVMHSGQDVDIVASSSMIINGTVDGTVTLASGYQPGSIVRLATNTYAVFGNLL